MVVTSEVKNGMGWLKINLPKVLNAINAEVVELLTNALEEWQDDANVLFVCLFGAGEKGFCAGGDMRKFYDLEAEEVIPYAERFFSTEYRTHAFIKVRGIHKMNGHVLFHLQAFAKRFIFTIDELL